MHGAYYRRGVCRLGSGGVRGARVLRGARRRASTRPRSTGSTRLFRFDDRGRGNAGSSTCATGRSPSPKAVTEPADVTIQASGEIFDRIVAGEQNPAMAYMTGKVKVDGDLGAAMKLQKLFERQLDEHGSAAGDVVALADVDGVHRRRRTARRAASPSSSPRARRAAGGRATRVAGGDEHAEHRARHRRGDRSTLAPALRAPLRGREIGWRRGWGRRQVEPERPAPGRRRQRRRRRERRVLDEERSRRLAGAERRMRDEPAQERKVRRHAR